jgi:hypothetical protein
MVLSKLLVVCLESVRVRALVPQLVKSYFMSVEGFGQPEALTQARNLKLPRKVSDQLY